MIRFVLRFIGLLLLALAFIFVIYDGMKSIADGGLTLTKFSQMWTEVHVGSLQAFQAVIERYAGAELWRVVISPILAQPVAAVFGVIGVVLIVLGRKKKPLIGYARD
jgi:hypothetical protein